jgi:hypothetical protein
MVLRVFSYINRPFLNGYGVKTAWYSIIENIWNKVTNTLPDKFKGLI